MDVVAAAAEVAVAVLEESETELGFVGGVGHGVAAQLFGSVGELAPFTVGTIPSCGEVTAQRTLKFASLGSTR